MISLRDESLGKIWDDKHPVDQNCYWTRSNGMLITLKDMGVFHLYHALILVWNYGIPEDYKFPPFRSSTKKFTRKKRRWFIANFYNELLNRKRGTWTNDMRKTLDQMAKWVACSKRKESPAKLW